LLNKARAIHALTELVFDDASDLHDPVEGPVLLAVMVELRKLEAQAQAAVSVLEDTGDREDFYDGPSDEDQVDAAYPWRAGFTGS